MIKDSDARQFFHCLIHFPGTTKDRILSGLLTGILTGAGIIPVFFIQYKAFSIAVHLTLFVLGYFLVFFLVWRWVYLPQTSR